MSINNDFIFQKACSHGDLNLVKELISKVSKEIQGVLFFTIFYFLFFNSFLKPK